MAPALCNGHAAKITAEFRESSPHGDDVRRKAFTISCTVRSRATFILAVRIFVALCVIGPAAMRAAEPLTIVLSPEAAHPGDVVRVDIPGARSFSTEVFGRESHSGLVGIDLDTKPGPYMLRV